MSNEGSQEKTFVRRERATLEDFLPGLDEALAKVPLRELETRGGPALPAFKEAGGPGLLIPKERGGLGAGPVEAIRIQRAIASRSPSLAVGTNMHHLSAATFVEHLQKFYAEDAFEWSLVQGVAEQRMLVSSALAEGRSGVSNLIPTVRAARSGENFVINGSKKPVSLSTSMELFSGTVLIEGDDEYAGKVAFVVVPAGTPGMETKPFWTSPILAGAESDEVVFHDVTVPENLVVTTNMRPGESMDPLLIRGWTWFELLMVGAYVGITSGLVERVMHAGKVSPGDLGQMGAGLEAAMAAAEGVAQDLGPDGVPSEALPRALFARYAAQDTVIEIAGRAAEALGGISFIRDTDVGYLFAAARALAFHPPSRAKGMPALGTYLDGDPFDTTVF